MLPLTRLELARAGRRKSTYTCRVIMSVLAAVALLLGLLFLSGNPGAGREPGEWIAAILTGCQFFLVTILPPIMAVPPLQQDRREGMAELLMLADTHGYDVVLSRYIGALLPIFFTFLSALPVFAIAVMLGGVSMKHVMLNTLIQTAWLSAGCALSVVAAAFSRGTTSGILLAYALLGLGVFVTASVFVAASGLGLIGANIGVFAAVQHATHPLVQTIASVFITVASLPIAAAGLRRADRAGVGRFAGSRRRKSNRRVGNSAKRFLIAASRGGTGSVGMAVSAFLAALLPALLPCFFFLGSMAALALAFTCGVLIVNRLKDDRVLEDLCLTPMTDRLLFHELSGYLHRCLWPFIPALSVAMLTPVLFLVLTDVNEWWLIAVVAPVPVFVLALAQTGFAAAAALQVSLPPVPLKQQLGGGMAELLGFHFMAYGVIFCALLFLGIASGFETKAPILTGVVAAIFLFAVSYAAVAKGIRDWTARSFRDALAGIVDETAYY